MAFRRKQHDEVRVDLTPMVDVVFLLLIFFMISTTFVDSQGIDINLPRSSAKKQISAPKQVKVYLNKDGRISVDKKEMKLAQLKRYLAGFSSRAAKTTFVLMADKQSYHGRVVEVMDAARDAGFRKLAIATKPR